MRNRDFEAKHKRDRSGRFQAKPSQQAQAASVRIPDLSSTIHSSAENRQDKTVQQALTELREAFHLQYDEAAHHYLVRSGDDEEMFYKGKALAWEEALAWIDVQLKEK